MAPTGTTRSTASTGSQARVTREDSDVYAYALRVAVLQANMAQPPTASQPLSTVSSSASSSSTPAPAPHAPTATASALAAPHVRTSSAFRPDAWTKSLFSPLGDVFSASGNGKDGSVRLPKEFLKVMDTKMAQVARGAEPAYTDPLFRQTIGTFYGAFANPAAQRQFKANRQLEEIILRFTTTSSEVLKKQLPGDEWKLHLEHQVGQFMLLSRDCLRSREVKNVPAELLQRLDAHCAKLSGQALPPTPSTSKNTLDAPPPPVPGMATNVQEMPLVQAVGRIFGKTDAELTKDVISLRRQCTEKVRRARLDCFRRKRGRGADTFVLLRNARPQAAYNDLKLCIDHVAQGARFPARREDFDLDDTFQAWKKQESAELTDLLVEMISRNPSLRSAPSEVPPKPSDVGSVSNRSSVVGLSSPSPEGSTVGTSSGDEDSAVSDAFVFVPPDPRFYYKRLYEIALHYDYDRMSELPPDEAVALTILSPVDEDLLHCCAVRWRIIPPVRASTFLALITQLYKDSAVPVACVSEALQGLNRVAEDWPYSRWPWADVSPISFLSQSMPD